MFKIYLRFLSLKNTTFSKLASSVGCSQFGMFADSKLALKLCDREKKSRDWPSKVWFLNYVAGLGKEERVFTKSNMGILLWLHLLWVDNFRCVFRIIFWNDNNNSLFFFLFFPLVLHIRMGLGTTILGRCQAAYA